MLTIGHYWSTLQRFSKIGQGTIVLKGFFRLFLKTWSDFIVGKDTEIICLLDNSLTTLRLLIFRLSIALKR